MRGTEGPGKLEPKPAPELNALRCIRPGVREPLRQHSTRNQRRGIACRRSGQKFSLRDRFCGPGAAPGLSRADLRLRNCIAADSILWRGLKFVERAQGYPRPRAPLATKHSDNHKIILGPHVEIRQLAYFASRSSAKWLYGSKSLIGVD